MLYLERNLIGRQLQSGLDPRSLTPDPCSPCSFRSRIDDLYLALLAPCAEDFLIELTDAGLWDFADESPAFWDPPFRHPLGEERAERFSVRACALAQHHASQRALVPTIIWHAYDGGLDNVGVRHQSVFKLHGRDPLAAGFDDILRAVRNLNEPLLVDRPYVSSPQPPFVEFFRRVIAVITRGDPRAANFDLAYRLAVPGNLFSVIDQTQIDAVDDAPCLRAPVHLLSCSQHLGM